MRVDDIVAPVVEEVRTDRGLKDGPVELAELPLDRGEVSLRVDGLDPLVLVTQPDAQVVAEEARRLEHGSETLDVDLLDRLPREEDEQGQRNVSVEEERLAKRRDHPPAR